MNIQDYNARKAQATWAKRPHAIKANHEVGILVIEHVGEVARQEFMAEFIQRGIETDFYPIVNTSKR